MGNVACGGGCCSRVLSDLTVETASYVFPDEWAGEIAWSLMEKSLDVSELGPKDEEVGKVIYTILVDQSRGNGNLSTRIPMQSFAGSEEETVAKIGKAFAKWGQVAKHSDEYYLELTSAPEYRESDATRYIESPFDSQVMTSGRLLGLAYAVELVYSFDEDVHSPGGSVTAGGLRTSPTSGRLRSPEEQWKRVMAGDVEGLIAGDIILGLRDKAGMAKDTELLQWVRDDESGVEAGLLKSAERQTVYAIFRGTLGWKDVHTDLQFFMTRMDDDDEAIACGCEVCCKPAAICHCCKPAVHSGFWNQFLSGAGLQEVEGSDGQELEPTPDGMIAKALSILRENPTWTMVVAGHSLGGALATLFAYEMANRGTARTVAATFGCPRVGNAVFAERFREFEAEGRLVLWRVQNQGDVVSRVPGCNYEHVGTHVWLRGDEGPCEVYQAEDSPCMANIQPILDPTTCLCCGDGSFHNMQSYIDILEEVQEKEGPTGAWRDFRDEGRKNNMVVAKQLIALGAIQNTRGAPKPVEE
eukprot:TRINITY_DN9257_c1_g1_i1.p1 TRINITY_DN9257_c1_g1~~TRINITY_DN9257_c1_g1_i1.p1  ORF type:complete len:527 (+),score=158.05 TRINITY_DN9257_c1_g1_i1:192-1772(+)